MGIGVGQAGKRLAEIGLRVAELLREGFRLFFHVPSGNPAHCGKGGVDGSAGFILQIGMQGQPDAWLQSQGIADNRG